MRPAAASATRKRDSSSSSEESDSEDEQPSKGPVSSEFTHACSNCFVCQLCEVMNYYSTCPLIIEAKTGAAPTTTAKSVGLNKVAAQKKQESSSEDSSDSEDEEPPKVH